MDVYAIVFNSSLTEHDRDWFFEKAFTTHDAAEAFLTEKQFARIKCAGRYGGAWILKREQRKSVDISDSRARYDGRGDLYAQIVRLEVQQ